MTARASATRRAIPPDRLCGIRSPMLVRPTEFSLSVTRLRISSSDSSVCSRNGAATFSNTVKSVNSAPSCSSTPISFLHSYSSWRERLEIVFPLTSTLPLFGCNWPDIKRRMVVFPTPLGPMIATILPRLISMLTSLRITLVPRLYSKLRMRMIGSFKLSSLLPVFIKLLLDVLTVKRSVLFRNTHK